MSNTKKVAPVLKKDIQTKLDSLDNTSQKIRYLNSVGVPRADIARILNKRYQHVRNVLEQPIKSKPF